MIRGWHLSRINSPEVDINDMPIAHTDITRLQRGLVGGVFWSAYVPWLVNTENLHLDSLSDPT
jgi:membrane dipeptidase